MRDRIAADVAKTINSPGANVAIFKEFGRIIAAERKAMGLPPLAKKDRK